VTTVAVAVAGAAVAVVVHQFRPGHRLTRDWDVRRSGVQAGVRASGACGHGVLLCSGAEQCGRSAASRGIELRRDQATVADGQAAANAFGRMTDNEDSDAGLTVHESTAPGASGGDHAPEDPAVAQLDGGLRAEGAGAASTAAGFPGGRSPS
jgi:hypothetical protein